MGDAMNFDEFNGILDQCHDKSKQKEQEEVIFCAQTLNRIRTYDSESFQLYSVMHGMCAI